MHKSLRVFPLILIVALALPCAALADAAPPLQPPASSIAAGDVTQVQMVAETVVLEVLPPPDSGYVQVEARFTLRNQGTAEERLAVRFPLEDLTGMGDGYRRYPEIEEIAVAVAGEPVPVRTVEEPPTVEEGETVSWAAFDVVFPVGEDVEIIVTYATRLTGYEKPDPGGYSPASLHYILETGAGWQGPIGSADIVLRLPYEAGPENVYLELTSPGGVVAGHEVRWHYEDLEPAHEDNWQASIVWPDSWLHALSLQGTVSEDPGKVGAWVELAEAYRHAGSEKHGLVFSEPLAALSQAVAEEAVARHPTSAAAHAELARVRWWRLRDWDTLQTTGDLGDAAVQAVLREVDVALARDAGNLEALRIRNEVFDWLGITPTPAPTNVPSVTPGPTPTTVPAAPPEREATPSAPAAWPLVVGLALVLGLAPAAAKRPR